MATARGKEQEAKKAADSTKGFSFFSFGDKEDKWQKAVDLYESAARLYRNDNEEAEAARVYEIAAKIHAEHLNDDMGSINATREAANAYKKINPGKSIELKEKICQHYIEGRGNWAMAASQQKEIAEMYEEYLDDIGKAAQAYRKAGELSEKTGKEYTTRGYFENFADRAALQGALLHDQPDKIIEAQGYFAEAAAKYEEIAEDHLKVSRQPQKSYARNTAFDTLLKAGICWLSKDVLDVKKRLEKFASMDEGFPTSDQGQFLAAIVKAVENKDGQEFSEMSYQYDRKRTMDKWMTTLLVRIKQDIDKADEDFS